MNELMRALGLQLIIDEISIKLQTVKILIEESKSVQSPYSPGSGGLSISGISSFTYGTPVYIPHVYWSFQTEFGQQLTQYMGKQYSQMYPWGGLSGYPQGMISNQQGLTISYPSSGLSSGVALQQQMQQHQAQQAAQQAGLYGQGQYKITSSGAVSQGQLILQSPSSTVVIKNLEDDSDKKSWVKRIKEFISGTTS